ncbi:MAG: DUF3025 domain-containing protein [Betaproteobacteria bacterium]|nr:DUF3025 domain-containing protein [Betaproteobacteria bacterium]
MTVDARLAPGHPAFAFLEFGLDVPALARIADIAGLQALLRGTPRPVVNERGAPLQLVGPAGPVGAADYERRVYERAELVVRPDTWHDRFNVLAWRVFPRAKAALNARHASDLAVSGDVTRRSRLRDALTLFDEDGMIVAVSDASIEARIRAFEWRTVFWDERVRLATGAAFVPFGHALMEKLLDPFVGLTAKAIFVRVPANFGAWQWSQRQDCLDASAARIIGALATPRDLAPLPVLGIPGWWPDTDRREFYDDSSYFRPGRRGDQRRASG